MSPRECLMDIVKLKSLLDRKNSLEYSLFHKTSTFSSFLLLLKFEVVIEVT